MKKHIHPIARQLPGPAMSVVEIDGMFQKVGRMVATLTSVYNFWQLVTNPED